MSDDDEGVKAFGASFQGFLRNMANQSPTEEPPVVRWVREHLGVDPAELVVVSATFPPHDVPNLQRALDGWADEPGRSLEVRGLRQGQAHFHSPSLSQLLSTQAGGLMGGGPTELGPASYEDRVLQDDTVLSCLSLGLLRLVDGDVRAIAYVHKGISFGDAEQASVALEVLAVDVDASRAVLADLRARIRRDNVYRGQVISISTSEHFGKVKVEFHRVPKVSRGDIVLPVGLLDRIERHTTAFARHRERLRAAGQHLKRGVLLHGPPGTGKTLSVRYLVSEMPDRTVLVLSGSGLSNLAATCQLARLLAPSTVLIEDVDLIAKSREVNEGANPILFELLNQMDGLDQDADVLFLLTTNRFQVLEEALSSRPGRVDVSIEVPLPDEAARRALIALYGRELDLPGAALDGIVRRTEGVSAAFLRELVRKAALRAAEQETPDAQGRLAVSAQDLDGALRDMLSGGKVARAIVGFRQAEDEVG
ncbi:MAG: 26S protease regulatory subunit [Alphaproteobacteria bacterium]|nr:26S protease regulatory subunit [Alphaproteobacteria bacterium]